jgi:hypothetical protein
MWTFKRISLILVRLDRLIVLLKRRRLSFGFSFRDLPITVAAKTAATAQARAPVPT